MNIMNVDLGAVKKFSQPLFTDYRENGSIRCGILDVRGEGFVTFSPVGEQFGAVELNERSTAMTGCITDLK